MVPSHKQSGVGRWQRFAPEITSTTASRADATPIEATAFMSVQLPSKVASEPEAILAVLVDEALTVERIGLEAGVSVVCVETRHM